jgi:hypothetical protein
MPHLSIEKRFRIISIYYEKNLSLTKKRFEVLNEFSKLEGIFVHLNTIKRIMHKWFKTQKVGDIISTSRSIKTRKISSEELASLDELIFNDRGLSRYYSQKAFR